MSKISGPVSMYYLKPISNDMPIILLFGDHHFSYDHMCNKAEAHEVRRTTRRVQPQSGLRLMIPYSDGVSISDYNRSHEGSKEKEGSKGNVVSFKEGSKGIGRSKVRRSRSGAAEHAVSFKEGSKGNYVSFIEIYSPEFLKQLDKLSTPSRPVDFYVEYFDDNDNGSFNSPLDKFTEPLFQPCYKKTIKRGSRCPAPNIRWHYSDIRLSKLKNNIEYIFDTLYVFTQFCEAVVKHGRYEGVSLESWKQISDTIHKRNMKFGSKLIEQLVKERRDLNTPYKILDFYRKCTGIDVEKKSVLRKIIEVFETKDSASLAANIVDLIFSYTNASAHPSLIYKQFVKQDGLSLFSRKEFIVNALRKSLERKMSYKPPSETELSQLLSFDIAPSQLDTPLLHINSTFVDLYMILRMMKKIDKPPALCIGYFGNMHVQNLVNILMQTEYYKLDHSVEEYRENRCLPFEIDLRKDLAVSTSRSSKRYRRSTRKSYSEK